jgi:hypothetical protein
MHGFAAEPGWRHPGLGNPHRRPLAVLKKLKGHGGAARGELTALAIMTWGVATTDEKGEVEGVSSSSLSGWF